MSVLERIVCDKRTAVDARKRERPLETFADRVGRSERSLEAALRAGKRAGAGYILECKRASPSKGLLRERYDPAAIATTYEASGAAAGISVLCDEPYFRGSLDHLRAVRDAVSLPVLCKDFILEPYQLVEAREAGADAALLMCSVLDDDALSRCLTICDELGLDALVEVHDGEELPRALAAGATLIGINNRDLKTLEVDLATTEALCDKVPDNVTLVSESGIGGHGDVRRLRDRCHGFLIGSSLMAREDIGAALREIVYGRVKICGLTREEDARAAWRAGATHGGLLLAPSPRRVDPARARAVRAAAPELRWIGVFVDEAPERVEALAHELALAAVQLHGDEPAEQVARLREALEPSCEVVKALRVREGVPLPRLAETGATRLLLDAYVRDTPGGSGKRFDWQRVEEHPERDELWLAGGLTPENAAEADALGCWGLDLSSGVERAPGEKDHDRLGALFAALRGRRGDSDRR